MKLNKRRIQNGHGYLVKSWLDSGLWFHVKGWRGFVEKQNPWIANQGPCNCYPLLLSSTQLSSTLSNQRPIFLTKNTQMLSQMLPNSKSQIILQIETSNDIELETKTHETQSPQSSLPHNSPLALQQSPLPHKRPLCTERWSTCVRHSDLFSSALGL